ncbi:MAG: PIN domain-containing protein [Actinomycetes bacterium]
MGWTALLDACVLFPMSTRDLLLRGAERYLYEVRWSAQIVEEVRRNLVEDQRCTVEQATCLIGQMTGAFPEAAVTGHEPLIEAMVNDPGDRHVLAAAITAGADVIVTDNVRHFPSMACDQYGIEVQTADELPSYSFDLAPEVMGEIFLQQVRDLERPALDAPSALAALEKRLPTLAARLSALPSVRSAVEQSRPGGEVTTPAAW